MKEIEKPLRLYFMDNIRILLTIIVILHHAMITYGGLGSWYFRDPHTDDFTSILLTNLVSFDQGFFMGLFFFISAYFVPGSYNRKGPRKFLKDRLIRLGIPLFLYTIFVEPILAYILYIQPNSLIPFPEFYLSFFQSWERFVEFLGENGPMWFLMALLIFDICYILWRQIYRRNIKDVIITKLPKNFHLSIITLLMAIFTFFLRLFFPINGGDNILNIQLCFIVQYIIMLILGVIAYNREWFKNMPYSQGTLWLIVVVISSIALIPVIILGGAFTGNLSKFLGGLNWQAFAYSLWESFYCMGMCIGLVILFRERCNAQGNITKTVSQNAYTIYIIHAPILVSITMLFAVILIPALLKLVIVFPLVLLISFLISHFILRRIPGAKRVLG